LGLSKGFVLSIKVSIMLSKRVDQHISHR